MILSILSFLCSKVQVFLLFLRSKVGAWIHDAEIWIQGNTGKKELLIVFLAIVGVIIGFLQLLTPFFSESRDKDNQQKSKPIDPVEEKVTQDKPERLPPRSPLIDYRDSLELHNELKIKTSSDINKSKDEIHGLQPPIISQQICDTESNPVPKDKLLKECQDAVFKKDHGKLRILADNGLAAAAAEYGMVLVSEKRYTEAHQYIIQSDRDGSNLGKYLLGLFYINGFPPVLKDIENGYKLIRYAADNGNKEAITFLIKHPPAIKLVGLSYGLKVQIRTD